MTTIAEIDRALAAARVENARYDSAVEHARIVRRGVRAELRAEPGSVAAAVARRANAKAMELLAERHRENLAGIPHLPREYGGG